MPKAKQFRSERRNEVVDLTADLDDEKPVIYDPYYGPTWLKVPIPGTASVRPANTIPRSQSNNVRVPLPGSASQSLPPSTYTSAWQAPNGNTWPASSYQHVGLPGPSNAWLNVVPGVDYISVQQTVENDTANFEGSDRGEKRRKTSGYGQAIPLANRPTPTSIAAPLNTTCSAQDVVTRGDIHMDGKMPEKQPQSRIASLETRLSPANVSAISRNFDDVLADGTQAYDSQPRPIWSGTSYRDSTQPGRHPTWSLDPLDIRARVPAFSVHYSSGLLKICSKRIPRTDADFQAASQKYAPFRNFDSVSRRSSANSPSILESHSAGNHDTDSIISSTSFPQNSTGLVSQPTSMAQAAEKKHHVLSSALQKISGKGGGTFSEEEEHLLIFLKEVKMFKWTEITAEFNKDYPGRPYHTLQSRYSTKINRRDRSLDPLVLKLPARWRSEAAIDWATVHATTSRPRERVHVNGAPTSQRESTQDAHSTGDESTQRQSRPRRAPVVNYDVRKIRRQYDPEIFGDGVQPETLEQTTGTGQATRSVTPEVADATPGPAIAVENDPVEVDFDARDAMFALPLKGDDVISSLKPYLSTDQRMALQNPTEDVQWDQLYSRQVQGAVMHVDFSSAELKIVEGVITKKLGPSRKTRHTTVKRRLRTLLCHIYEPKILQLAHALRKTLRSRTIDSIEAFLQDARAGTVAETPTVQRLAAARTPRDMTSINKDSAASWVRQREIGTSSNRGWRTSSKAVTYQVRNKVIDTLGPVLSWTGASSDIHTVAWSPSGDFFAAGAVAVTDPDSMQYNRPNNLLFGDLTNDTIHELAEHSIQRKKTETGANSTHAMFVSQDPELYTTVTAVAFSPSGRLMFSAGYDNRMRVWNLDSPQPVLAAHYQHSAKVELMVVNDCYEGMVATAAQKTNGRAVKFVRLDENEPKKTKHTNFFSEKAVSRSDLNILPQALQFEPSAGRLLLAGFGANVRADSRFDLTGDLCLWDIDTGAQLNIHGSNRNVFDVTFNPNRRYLPLFAAGCVANNNVNRRTRSVIRLYDERADEKLGCPLEIECQALDMNDVVWCPHDEQFIAAGCTDGRVYVWDIRRSDEPLRTLSHGHSLMPLQDGIPHERTDTGVRFLSWGDNATRLYSGSSDGVVKVWDVTRSPEDTFIKDLVTLESGIMAGKFSPSYDKIILGEVNGSLNVLDVGRSDFSTKDAKDMRYVPYDPPSHTGDQKTLQSSGLKETLSFPADSRVEEGRWLLQSEQLSLAPLGNLPIRQVLQGPNYQGPFDQSVEAPFLREQALRFQSSMTASPTSQCTISDCKDNIVKTTSEDIGDSKRSEDRIPDTLRREWLNIDSKARVLWGRTKCSHCGRSARPLASEDSLDASALCERCSFSCFRCGSSNPIAPATTTLICDTCAGVWDIGSLGYECMTEPKSENLELQVPRLRRFGREMLEERTEEEASFGDEMNALTDHYFSLAIDRPESPPL